MVKTAGISVEEKSVVDDECGGRAETRDCSCGEEGDAFRMGLLGAPDGSPMVAAESASTSLLWVAAAAGPPRARLKSALDISDAVLREREAEQQSERRQFATANRQSLDGVASLALGRWTGRGGRLLEVGVGVGVVTMAEACKDGACCRASERTNERTNERLASEGDDGGRGAGPQTEEEDR